MNRNLIFLSFILLLQIPTFTIEAAPPSIAKNSTCEIEREDEFYSAKQLQTLANKITVKVIGDNNGGSGTLIGKQGNNYLVLTNSHVIQGVNSIKLQTADGKTYSAEVVPKNNFKNSDITLLKFRSNQNYCLSEIANTTPDIDTPVLASGFSVSTGKIKFSSGKVKKTSNLKEAYEIGYSSYIEQGMSGGAILNSLGELVGINGKSSYPILNTGYVYQNGKRPSEAEIQEMRKLSWGIPISTVLTWVDSDVLTAYKLPLPDSSITVAKGEYTGWLGDLEQKAKQFTVRIDSSSNTNGSGIIIAKEGNTYTVLTSAHVLCEREDATKPCGDFNYEIFAPDGNKYTVDESSIKIEEGVDLAVVKFKSPQNYQIATFANYNPNSWDYIFTAGYPKLKSNSPWRFTVGRIFDKEWGLIQTNQSDFQNPDSDEFQTSNSLSGGYELVYSSITYGGMSGGPVLDSLGRVIGIHGRAEGEQTGDSGQVQIGYSLGIPVSTFLGLVPQLGTKPLKLGNTKAPQLSAQKKKSIQEAILSISFSGGNASASQWLERGNQLWRLSRYEEAIQAFDEAIKQKPSFAYLAFYGKGLALIWDRKIEQGIIALEQVVKLQPDFIDAWRYQSVAYQELKQLDKALLAINKAVELQPINPTLYIVKSSILKDLKKYAQAEAEITEAIKKSPRAVFHLNRGNLYHDQEKWDLALADYNKAIQINPNHAATYNSRGIIYKNQKKWNLALADYNKAITISPDYAPPYFNRGIVYKNQKKWDLALADYNKSIEIEPEYAKNYYYRGVLFYEQKKWELAMANFNEAIEIEPKYSEAYKRRGMVYYKQKKWELALVDYNKTIEIEPENTDAYNNRGLVYSEQNKWELALADYNKAIQINPENAIAYYNRGHLYTGKKKWNLALADYNKAIQINPENASAYNNRGLIYFEQKKWDLAIADYNKAIQINPDHANAYAAKGLFMMNRGNNHRAIQNMQKAAQLFKSQGNTELYKKVVNTLQKIQK